MLPHYRGVNTKKNSQDSSESKTGKLIIHQAPEFDLSKNASRAKSSTGIRGNKGDFKLMPTDVIYEKRTSS